MKKTRIEIHLDESEVVLLDKIAEQNGRSRKNYCENQIRISIQDLTKSNVEIKAFEQPKANFQINTMPEITGFAAYVAEIKDAKSVQQVEKIMKEVWKDRDLNSPEKQRLETIAKAKGIEIDQ